MIWKKKIMKNNSIQNHSTFHSDERLVAFTVFIQALGTAWYLGLCYITAAASTITTVASTPPSKLRHILSPLLLSPQWPLLSQLRLSPLLPLYFLHCGLYSTLTATAYIITATASAITTVASTITATAYTITAVASTILTVASTFSIVTSTLLSPLWPLLSPLWPLLSPLWHLLSPLWPLLSQLRPIL